MADLISRAEACECIGKMIHEHREKGDYALADGMILVRRYGIKCLPAVDAVLVVRCRDCKHRPTDNRYMDDMTGFAIEFPDGKCPCQCDDGWYNWYPDDDWFCANGERRDDDAAD